MNGKIFNPQEFGRRVWLFLPRGFCPRGFAE